jgi:hypothetical protein
VKNSLLVRRRHAVRDVRSESRRLSDRHLTAELQVDLHALRQELGGDVEASAFATDVEDAEDVLVLYGCDLIR